MTLRTFPSDVLWGVAHAGQQVEGYNSNSDTWIAELVEPSGLQEPEEMDAFADGMSAGHVAARTAIKARRADLPVGLSLAIVDDVVVGEDSSVRDRKRAEVYERWLELARDDDFVGVRNYEWTPMTTLSASTSSSPRSPDWPRRSPTAYP
jgi:beta-glucosidase/6-phospho-beta-glucosidase/beta-galactosidase